MQSMTHEHVQMYILYSRNSPEANCCPVVRKLCSALYVKLLMTKRNLLFFRRSLDIIWYLCVVFLTFAIPCVQVYHDVTNTVRVWGFVFLHLASVYLPFGDEEELISILQKMDSSNITILWLKHKLLEAGRFHLLGTLKHNFQVSNKEDPEDFILSRFSTTTAPNNTGMVR